MTNREYLLHLEMHGIKLGLDNIRFLLDAAGLPERCYPVVHIAGTNGKGSVVAILAGIARAAGYRVGRFTSPHLIDVTERFLIDGQPIPNAALEENIDFFRRIAEKMDTPPTFFEMNTAIAFRWFAQNNVDLAVIEVGMGGRLDSTNVVEPLATAVTNIALDHTRYLGETLEEIAFEKAGIIKHRVPVILTETASPAQDVLLAHAAELESPVRQLGRDFRFSVTGDPLAQRFAFESESLRLSCVPLGLSGAHQGANAAAAVALAESLIAAFPGIDKSAIEEGLCSVRWPCRLERVLETPAVYVDVAHNPAGAQKIAQALPRCTLLLAVSADKDAAGIIRALAPIAEDVILTRYTGSRSASVYALEAALDRPVHLEPSLPKAIELGLLLANSSKPLLITGSIFTAGEARKYLTQHHGAPPLRF